MANKALTRLNNTGDENEPVEIILLLFFDLTVYYVFVLNYSNSQTCLCFIKDATVSVFIATVDQMTMYM